MAALPRHASRTGLVGDPTVANAAKGGRCFEVIVSVCLEFLRECAHREVKVTLDFPLTHPRTDIYE